MVENVVDWVMNNMVERVPEDYRGMITIDEKLCTLCGACVSECPSWAIEIFFEEDIGYRIFYVDRCTFCGRCVDVCPEDALKMTSKYILSHISGEEIDEKISKKLIKCINCGRPFITKEHIESIKRFMEEKLGDKKDIILRDFDKYVLICDECRRKMVYGEKYHPGKYMVGV